MTASKFQNKYLNNVIIDDLAPILLLTKYQKRFGMVGLEFRRILTQLNIREWCDG